MNKYIFLATSLIILSACGGSKTNADTATSDSAAVNTTDTQMVPTAPEKKYVYKEVESTEQFNLPAEQVWSTIAAYDNFNALLPDLFVGCVVTVPNIEVGTKRIVTAADGNELVHEISLFKPEDRELRYKVLQNPLMTQDEEVLIKVTKAGEARCKLRLFTTFNAEEGTEENVFKSAKQIHDGIIAFFKNEETRLNPSAPINPQGIQ